MTTTTANKPASKPAKSVAKTVELDQTKVIYTTDKSIYAALDKLTDSEKSFRSELQAVIVSAMAHHEACAAKGGSIGTVMTKVWSRIEDMKAVPKAQLSRYFSAVFPKLTWNKREKRFDGSHKAFRPVIKPANGKPQHYSSINFWDFAPKANRSAFNVDDRITALIKSLQRAINSEEHPLEGDAKLKAITAVDFLSTVQEGRQLAELSKVASLAHAGKTIELKATPQLTQH